MDSKKKQKWRSISLIAISLLTLAIVYVARNATPRIMTVTLTVGARLPAYCTSLGRVLLAGMKGGTLQICFGGHSEAAARFELQYLSFKKDNGNRQGYGLYSGPGSGDNTRSFRRDDSPQGVNAKRERHQRGGIVRQQGQP